MVWALFRPCSHETSDRVRSSVLYRSIQFTTVIPMSDALDPERLGTKRTPALIELADGSEARSPPTRW
jgi:hypothetical protein